MKQIIAATKPITLYWTTGKVADAGKNMETIVRGGGGGGYTYNGTGSTAPVTITSTTVVHDQIFLVDRDGREHAFQLQGFNVACRTDNQLSIIWAIREGKKTGPYIIAYNHSTRNAFYNDASLNKLFRYPVYYLLGAMLACLLLGRISGLFYALFLAAPIVWLLLARQQAKRFKNSLDFSEFDR
ncbi:MAG TPA: hypothetical protein VHE34_10920 [Puia sp.]|uniref:hypothetical protein n=1 Tax=Puia sp. TaxID=2045100 RepID=UPI002C97E861|nr:hypothetical protein [Puia sp.]HVU95729.1 hypothetical protein [Puia sp.]